MSNVQNITDENFGDMVLTSEKVFVLDFSSDWCPPCKIMDPIFEEMANELEDSVNFGTIDVSAHSQTPTNYGVLAIPTFIIFKNGEAVRRLMGVVPKEKFKAEIEKAL